MEKTYKENIIVGDFETVFANDDANIVVGNNCIVHAKSGCRIVAGYNSKIYIKGNCDVIVGEYGYVIDTVGGSRFSSKKGTKFNVLGINTFDCVDSTICLQFKKRTANVLIPNRVCVLKKELPNTIEVDNSIQICNEEEEDKKDQKSDNSFNILEYKNGDWVQSNNIYPFDWGSIERNRKADKKRK